MSADTFADTNVLAYLVSSDAGRRAVARAVFAGQPVISTLVVNEFLNVCLRKAKLEREAAHALATGLMTGCETVRSRPRPCMRPCGSGCATGSATGAR